MSFFCRFFIYVICRFFFFLERNIFLFQVNLFQSRIDQILNLKQRMVKGSPGLSLIAIADSKPPFITLINKKSPLRIFLMREVVLVLAERSGRSYKISLYWIGSSQWLHQLHQLWPSINLVLIAIQSQF